MLGGATLVVVNAVNGSNKLATVVTALVKRCTVMAEQNVAKNVVDNVQLCIG